MKTFVSTSQSGVTTCHPSKGLGHFCRRLFQQIDLTLHDFLPGAVGFHLQLSLQQPGHLAVCRQRRAIIESQYDEYDGDGDEKSVTGDGFHDEVEWFRPSLYLK